MHRHNPAGTRVVALRRVIGGLITALAVTAAIVLTSAATGQAELAPVNDSFETSALVYALLSINALVETRAFV
ncbi:hypothetical protein [Paractinoplanes rishiriensis]|uniref:Uncharacterized protein n=1 Tax=Paractinoplanes rishiriensis TaxID=1050105 RepID=A0A919K760_9ACTN|nr:hypothetical protein [Actinoplanes rishiriensis]GIF02211.1 hypothetical protein Ari01nite_96750 [Actinoplanes rishiriensis]